MWNYKHDCPSIKLMILFFIESLFCVQIQDYKKMFMEGKIVLKQDYKNEVL